MVSHVTDCKIHWCPEKLPTTGCYAQANQYCSNQHPTSKALEANTDHMDASYNVTGNCHEGDFYRKFGPAVNTACPCGTLYQTLPSDINLPLITDQWNPKMDLKASALRHHTARCNDYILILLFFLITPIISNILLPYLSTRKLCPHLTSLVTHLS